ncbi:MAG: hypothetical protein LUI87_05800 [Lachnospiraceae bacterium]|nr:hypothetical protein [Lachnospiraceae bacterium]
MNGITLSKIDLEQMNGMPFIGSVLIIYLKKISGQEGVILNTDGFISGIL